MRHYTENKLHYADKFQQLTKLIKPPSECIEQL